MAQEPPAGKGDLLSPSERQWLSDHRVLRLGVDPSNPPIEMNDASDNYVGIAADHVALIEGKLGVAMRPAGDIPWAAVLDKARNRELDVLPAVSPASELAQFLIFTEPFVELPTAIISRTGSTELGALGQLAGKRVAVLRANHVREWLGRNCPDIALWPLTDIEQGLRELSIGTVDAYVGDLATASYTINRLGLSNVTVAGYIPYTSQFCMGVRRDWPELVGILNKAIASISAPDKEAILEKWISIHPPGVDPKPVLVAFIMTLLVAPIIVLLTTTLRQRRELEDRKKAQRVIRESERRYRTLVETMNEGLVVVDEHGTITYLNDNLANTLGYAADEVLGRSVFDFADEKNKAVLKDKSSSIGGAQAVADCYEVDLTRKDGQRVSVIASAHGIMDEENSFKGRVVAITDITDRKRWEQALARSNRQWQDTFDAVSDLIMVLDNQYRILRVNRAMRLALGGEGTDVSGIPCFEAVHASAGPYPSCPLSRVLMDGLEHRQEVHEPRLGVTLDVRVYPMVDDDDHIHGAVHLARDMTKEKRMEQDLLAEKEKFRTLVECLPFAIMVVGNDGQFEYVSPRFKEMFGYDHSEFPHGKDWFDKAFPDRAIRNEALRSWIDYSKDPRSSEHGPRIFPVRCKDETDKVIHFRPVSLGQGAHLMTCEDVTDRKRTEQLLMQAERARAVADLAAGVAHNFNNLLQVVMGGTQLVQTYMARGNLSEARLTIGQILESCRFGGETVKRLQYFAGIRSDGRPSEKSVFDLSDIVRQSKDVTAPLLKSQADRRGVRIDLQSDLLTGCLVRGRKNELFEVMVNLLKNASEALPNGGTITVSTRIEATLVVLRVQDTGTGISQENLNRLFNPFFTTKTEFGTGLGLATSRSIIEGHNGDIMVDSSEGKGTTFIIRLPLVRNPAQDDERIQTLSAPTMLRILLVDDMAPVLDVLESGLEQAGHTVFKALSGEEGIAIFEQNPIDLIICDLGMPGMNGWQVCTRINAICEEKAVPSPPFILLTGWGGQSLPDVVASGKGPDMILEKPIDMEKLFATVDTVMKNRGVRRGRTSEPSE